MSETIFLDGYPHNLIQPMYAQGFGVSPGMVFPDFAAALLRELREDGQYQDINAIHGRGPDVHHNEEILNDLHRLPHLAEYLTALNTEISEVSGFDHNHLTYLTVRACPAHEQMSTNIHRNDVVGGPWLVTLTVEGTGSVNIYPDHVLQFQGQEIELTGNPAYDPVPLASSPMQPGDAWGAYSMDWSPPHAGGRNTSEEPKILILLYGWRDRSAYVRHAQERRGGSHTDRERLGNLHLPGQIFL